MSTADDVCPFVDVELQEIISARLLHCLAARAAKHKLSPEDAVAKLRDKLMSTRPAKKEVLKKASGLDLLHAALDEADEVKAKGLRFFESKEKLSRRTSEAEKDLNLSRFRAPARERLAAELIAVYDIAHEYHCGCPLVCGQASAPASADGDDAASASSEDRNTVIRERHRARVHGPSGRVPQRGLCGRPLGQARGPARRAV